MKYKWTIADLDAISDKDLIRCLITERRSIISSNAPLDRRLKELENNIDEIIKEK